MEHSLEEGSPARTNTPAVLNSTQLSGAMARETSTISSVASWEPHIVTIETDSNEPTIPYGLGNQHPVVPPSLNELNLPPNAFIVLNNLVVIQLDEQYIPQSPEPSNLSPVSKPPINLSTIEGWETPHTSMDVATFYSGYEPRRFYWDFFPVKLLTVTSPDKYSSLRSYPPHCHLHDDKKKSEHGVAFFLKKESVAAQMRCLRPALPTQKTP